MFWPLGYGHICETEFFFATSSLEKASWLAFKMLNKSKVSTVSKSIVLFLIASGFGAFLPVCRPVV